MRVRGKISKPMKIDAATGQVSRGHFARICVEVDLGKPLILKFELRRRVRWIEYEGLHLMCFKCGMFNIKRRTAP